MEKCNTIKATCSGELIFSTCVKYETDLPSFSELPSGCTELDATTTELYKFIGEIKTETDLSELGESCLTYVQEGSKTIVKNVLLKFEEEICELTNRINILETESICTKNITACNFDFSGLVDSCGNQPSTLGETIQLILDTLNTP